MCDNNTIFKCMYFTVFREMHSIVNKCSIYTCSCLVTVLSDPLCPYKPNVPGSSVHGDSPLKNNTGVGCHFLLHGIFLTQELNPGLLHCRQILYQLSYKGSPTSASVLPMNIHGWFPLGLMGLISLQSQGLSRVFSSTTIWKHQFFGAQPSLWFNSHIHTWLLETP